MAPGTRTVEINEHVFELVRLAAALDRIDVTSYIEGIVMRDIETHSSAADAFEPAFAGRYAGLAPKPWIETEGLGLKFSVPRKAVPVAADATRVSMLSDFCDHCGRPLRVKMIESLPGEERHTFECVACDREQVRRVLLAGG